MMDLGRSISQLRKTPEQAILLATVVSTGVGTVTVQIPGIDEDLLLPDPLGIAPADDSTVIILMNGDEPIVLAQTA